MDLRFVSANLFKFEEAKTILSPLDINVIQISQRIEELQTKDDERLVKDKTLKAYGKIRFPLFVEHTGLHLDYLNGLPGGLTQIFWDDLRADKFSELFGNTRVTAETIIGYCNGRKIHTFKGTISGLISPEPRGHRDFQWDCIFIPDGYEQTFAEMGHQKNNISMRKIALKSFAEFLKREERCYRI